MLSDAWAAFNLKRCGILLAMDPSESAAGVDDSLTRRGAVLVGLRLAAVVVVLHSLFLLDSLVWFVGELFINDGLALHGVEDDWSSRLSFMFFQLGPLGVRVVLATLLWWLAPWLSRRIVPRNGCVFGRDSLAAEALLTVGLMLIGVYLALTAAAVLGVPAVQRFLQITPEDDMATEVLRWNRPDWPSEVLRLVLGGVLAGCRPLHRWLGARLTGDDAG